MSYIFLITLWATSNFHDLSTLYHLGIIECCTLMNLVSRCIHQVSPSPLQCTTDQMTTRKMRSLGFITWATTRFSLSFYYYYYYFALGKILLLLHTYSPRCLLSLTLPLFPHCPPPIPSHTRSQSQWWTRWHDYKPDYPPIRHDFCWILNIFFAWCRLCLHLLHLSLPPAPTITHWAFKRHKSFLVHDPTCMRIVRGKAYI